MPPPRVLGLAPEWDGRFTAMVGVSALGHIAVIAAVVLLGPLAAPRPLPMMAYTVELTDPSALGGRLPPGAPGRDLTGGSTAPVGARPAESPPAEKPATPPAPPPLEEPKPVAKAEPPPTVPEPPPKPVEKPPEQAAVKIPDQPKPPEPKPEPKPEAKPRPEPTKADAKPPEPKPAAKPSETKPTEAAAAKPGAKPDAKAAAAGLAGEKAGTPDPFSQAIERWKTRAGGGVGGPEGRSGPLGAGGDGKGGGGQVVALEFLAYRQQVINTIKSHWTNVIGRPGLVAKVYFTIAPDGTVDDVRLEQGSGNAAYDSSAVRAVQHTTSLPPPPPRYAGEFREFVIEFHSEEAGGGQGEG